MHHQPQVVFDKLIPCGGVARGTGQEMLLLLLGAQRGWEGAGVAQVQREKKEFRRGYFHQHVQHMHQPFLSV